MKKRIEIKPWMGIIALILIFFLYSNFTTQSFFTGAGDEGTISFQNMIFKYRAEPKLGTWSSDYLNKVVTLTGGDSIKSSIAINYVTHSSSSTTGSSSTIQLSEVDLQKIDNMNIDIEGTLSSMCLGDYKSVASLTVYVDQGLGLSTIYSLSAVAPDTAYSNIASYDTETLNGLKIINEGNQYKLEDGSGNILGTVPIREGTRPNYLTLKLSFSKRTCKVSGGANYKINNIEVISSEDYIPPTNVDLLYDTNPPIIDDYGIIISNTNPLTTKITMCGGDITFGCVDSIRDYGIWYDPGSGWKSIQENPVEVTEGNYIYKTYNSFDVLSVKSVKAIVESSEYRYVDEIGSTTSTTSGVRTKTLNLPTYELQPGDSKDYEVIFDVEDLKSGTDATFEFSIEATNQYSDPLSKEYVFEVTKD